MLATEFAEGKLSKSKSVPVKIFDIKMGLSFELTNERYTKIMSYNKTRLLRNLFGLVTKSNGHISKRSLWN